VSHDAAASPRSLKRVAERLGPSSLRRAIRRWRSGPSALYGALSTRPPILFVQDWSIGDADSPLSALLRRLRGRPVHVYYNTSWHVDESRGIPKHRARLAELRRRSPGLTATVLAQTPAEQALFAAHGIDALYCNQNCLVDERVFRVLPDVERRHDAVYDARLDPFKRHELAREVKRLALVTYLNWDTDRRFAAEVAADLRDATWFNGTPTPEVRLLSAEEVNRAYNACRVGLCLSEREGAMWASVQYLLAGLSVVSTESEGGREEFFDPDYVRIVKPTPRAVADAVAELCALGWDRSDVRRRTLARMGEHRRRFVDHVQGRLDEAGEERRFEDDWPRVFRHRMVDPSLAGRAKRREIARHNEAIVEAVDRGRPHPQRDPASDEPRPPA